MRDAISRFADRMGRQMDLVASRKGELSWHAASAGDLLMSVTYHRDKLGHTFLTRAESPERSQEEEAQFRKEIVHETTDMAAYLMMIADNAELGRSL